MRRRTRWVASAAVAIAAIGGGTGIAAATGGDDHDQPITGDALTRASAVAIAHAGGGRVNGSITAVDLSKAKFLETGSFAELLTIYHLFGDPALQLE